MQLGTLARQIGSGAEIIVAVFELEAANTPFVGQDRETVDLALVAVGDVVRQHFSPRRVAARMSDTTFVLLFPGDAPSAVSACCEAIRKTVAELEVGPLARGSLRVTFGLAIRRGNEAMADLLHQADMALFRAKDIRRTGLEVLQR
jgi:GGDEF domain-containing protein